MRRRTALAVAAALVVAAGCPSAYQRTYDKETKSLEARQQADDAQQKALHAEASKYAAVVYFEVGSAVVSDDGQRELRWLVGKLQPYPQAVLLVQGFADVTGTEAKNQTLSTDRAQAVAAYLQSQGFPPSRLNVQGHGTTSPAASNETKHGRGRNRRVEVTVQ
jgi:outer membrane protein OmpA-like peptidoglycan-associated protein